MDGSGTRDNHIQTLLPTIYLSMDREMLVISRDRRQLSKMKPLFHLIKLD